MEVGGSGAGGGVGSHCVLCDFRRFCFGCPKRGGHPFFSGVGGRGGGMPVLDARWKVGEVTVLAVISQHGSLNSPKIREFASFALPVRKSIGA